MTDLKMEDDYTDGEMEKFDEFFEACQKGLARVVASILSKNDFKPINYLDEQYKMTGLHTACSQGHSNVVETILKYRGPVKLDVNLGEGDRTETPLWAACTGGHTRVVEILLANHPDVDVSIKSNGYTPLERACRYKRVDVVKVLLRHGLGDVTDKCYEQCADLNNAQCAEIQCMLNDRVYEHDELYAFLKENHLGKYMRKFAEKEIMLGDFKFIKEEDLVKDGLLPRQILARRLIEAFKKKCAGLKILSMRVKNKATQEVKKMRNVSIDTSPSKLVKKVLKLFGIEERKYYLYELKFKDIGVVSVSENAIDLMEYVEEEDIKVDIESVNVILRKMSQ